MKKIFLALTALIILGVSCKKGYLDVNTNPNQSTSADPSLVLPAALANTVATWYPGPTFTAGWMGSWAISGSFAISSTDFTTYKMTNDFGDALWQTIYDNLEDYQYIDDKAGANGQLFLQGAAKIMKGYQFHHLVDMFNDVPYTTALKGVASLRPTYDKGMDVYDSSFNLITDGMNLISAATSTPEAKSDIMFGGNKDLWMKFANTVKLRMLLRMSQLTAKPAFFQTNLDLLKNDPNGFLGAGEDALVQPGYSNSPGKGNPFWQRYFNTTGGEQSSFGDFWRASAFGLNFYNANNDPRLTQVYAPIGTAPTYSAPFNYVGNELGLPNGNAVGSASSGFGPGVFKGLQYNQDTSALVANTSLGASAPAVMMLAAESFFLQAEAVALGYLTGDNMALYHQGIVESFRYYDVPDYQAAAEAYYAQTDKPDVAYPPTGDPLAKQTVILRQKWAALNSINSFEAWCDYRKFNYLHNGNPPYSGPLGDTPFSVSPYIDIAKIPLRLKYPTSEYSKNSANVAAEGTIDHQTSKVWWIQ